MALSHQQLPRDWRLVNVPVRHALWSRLKGVASLQQRPTYQLVQEALERYLAQTDEVVEGKAVRPLHLRGDG